MSNDSMNLRIKILTLPFTEFSFYKTDHFEKMATLNQIAEFDEHYRDDFIKDVYPNLIQRNRVSSLDELRLLIQKSFGYKQITRTDGNIYKFYLEYLQTLSRLFLTHRNGKVALKYWESKSKSQRTRTLEETDLLGPYKGIHKVRMWHSLNRMFTTDILVLLYLLQYGMEEEVYLKSYPSSVLLADIQLDQVLSKGVAETHLHLNAGGNFNTVWQNLMSPPLRNFGSFYKKLRLASDILDGDDSWTTTAQAMAVLRILIAHFLCRVRASERVITFESFYENFYKEKGSTLHQRVSDFLEKVDKGAAFKSCEIELVTLYNDLKDYHGLDDENPSSIEEEWQTAYAKKDVVHSLLNTSGECGSVETVFLFQCLKYMQKSECGDSEFCKLFWQYVRSKNRVFQIYVQDNQISGLDYFRSFFRRLADDRGYSGDRFTDIELILKHQLETPNLRKLEVRISAGSKSGVARQLINILNWYKDMIERLQKQHRPIPLLGVVVHFNKSEDNTGIEKCWLDGTSGQSKGEHAKIYYGEQRKKYEKTFRAIHQLREEVEGLSDYLVGIDAAGPELSTPPWVFAPVFQIARNSDENHKIMHESGRHIRNLGLTYHVGEDFRHLLTGIRQVDEVVDHFQFHAGDRIGHGMALGLDLVKWAAGHTVVTLPRIEYLENLLWVWGLYKDGGQLQIDATHLEQRILTCAKEIYRRMEGITVFNLWQAYQAKFNTFKISEKFNERKEPKATVFCQYIDSHDIWTEDKLIHAQHCKCYLDPMTEPIHIEIDESEIEMMTQTQRIVRDKLGREGIIVETNPSSNQIIGDLESIFSHYIQSLNRRGLDDSRDAGSGLMVTINTDDPLIFNTNINNEFAYIFYALQEKGYSREDILTWIDRVRETGLNSSFIKTREIKAEDLREELETMIAKLKVYL